MIKLDALRVFVMVADLGNIKDAAEQLCRTPSAVSMTLKQLEGSVGGALFETDRKSHLTALGAFTWETAKQEIQSYDRALGRIGAYAQNKSGKLVLASVPSVATTIVPELLTSFVAQRPNAEVELVDADTITVSNRVDLGKADLGIGGRPKNSASAEFEPLYLDKFVMICSEASPLVELNRPIAWADLKNENLIKNGASDFIEAAEFREISNKARLRVVNVISLLAMARENMGVTLLPSLAVKRVPQGLAVLEIDDVETDREVGILTRRSTTLTPLAQAFRQHISEHRQAFASKFGLTLV